MSKETEISFWVNDPEIIQILEAKKHDVEMSAYIVEALRSYSTHEISDLVDTVQELAKAIQTLVQSKSALSDGIDSDEQQLGDMKSRESPGTNDAKDEEEEAINQILVNSLESIWGL